MMKANNEAIRVCIAGSRNLSDIEVVTSHVMALPPNTEVVTGGSGVVDLEAKSVAERAGLKTTTFHADWQRHGRAAGPIRNRSMAEYADRLMAFWDGISTGTANCIKEFAIRKKPVMVLVNPTEDTFWTQYENNPRPGR